MVWTWENVDMNPNNQQHRWTRVAVLPWCVFWTLWDASTSLGCNRAPRGATWTHRLFIKRFWSELPSQRYDRKPPTRFPLLHLIPLYPVLLSRSWRGNAALKRSFCCLFFPVRYQSGDTLGAETWSLFSIFRSLFHWLIPIYVSCDRTTPHCHG